MSEAKIMQWTERGRSIYARCGHLFLRCEEYKAYKTPDHHDYEPASFEWFVEPDDEDKSYRRALATGKADTADAAKQAAMAACLRLAMDIVELIEKDAA